MHIALICTGDELLKGATVNTNLAFLGGKLLEIDFSQIDEAFVKEHRDLFVESQKDFVKYLEELPKKMGDKENETTR